MARKKVKRRKNLKSRRLAAARMYLRMCKEWGAHPSAVRYWKMQVAHLSKKR